MRTRSFHAFFTGFLSVSPASGGLCSDVPPLSLRAAVSSLPPSTRAADLRSDAWLLRGISSIPGELSLRRGRLRFHALHTGSAWRWQLRKLEREVGRTGLAWQVDAGKRSLVFDLPVRDVQISFPWYYFSGGMQVRTTRSCHRISLGKPANAQIAPGLGRAMGELQEVRRMRSAGALWRAALAEAALVPALPGDSRLPDSMLPDSVLPEDTRPAPLPPPRQ
jgi:hypothetical protein